MLTRFITKKTFFLYVLSLVLTWGQALLNPFLVSQIVDSFTSARLDKLWQILLVGIIGNLLILLGLSGKRYYYAQMQAEFKLHFKENLFRHFLYGEALPAQDLLSALENDLLQLEENDLEATVIIISSLGFMTVSIAYVLWTHFWLGLLFIGFYALPALSSSLGSKRLDQLSQQKAESQQAYLKSLTSLIKGTSLIRNYQAESLATKVFSDVARDTTRQELAYEKQRTLNSIVINGLDVFSSVLPIVIGGLMTSYGHISAAQFVAIYLVASTISYQFQELAYFNNTRKSVAGLKTKYQTIFAQDLPSPNTNIPDLFPIVLDKVSLRLGDQSILQDFSMRIEAGDKIAIIGPSGSGKSTLLKLIMGEMTPDSGSISYQGQTLDAQSLRQAISHIRQDSHYFDTLTLTENISLNSEVNQLDLKQVLAKTRLSSLANRPHISQDTLSGGEGQRLEVARSLYHQKRLILADEVKANLDPENAKMVEDLLFDVDSSLVEVIHHYNSDSLARYDKVIRL